MAKFEQYDHHGRKVWVQKKLKGKHRSHCLCFKCKRFKMNESVVSNSDLMGQNGLLRSLRLRQHNCPKANEVFRLCVLLDMVLPVWECPDFEER